MRRWCPRLLCPSPPSLSPTGTNRFTAALLPLLSRDLQACRKAARRFFCAVTELVTELQENVGVMASCNGDKQNSCGDGDSCIHSNNDRKDDNAVDRSSSLVKSQVCNILHSGNWNAKTKALLQPFSKNLSSSLVVMVLNSIKDLGIARNFFYWASDQDGYSHATTVYNAFMTKLGVAKEFVSMWELLDEMRREGCAITNTTFSIIIQSYGNTGCLEECWRTIKKATNFGVKPDVYMYTTLLGVLFRVGKIDKAKQLLNRMIRFNKTLDIRTWSIAIHGFCKNGKMQDAQVFMDKMQGHSCIPNVYIYNAMILGFSKANCAEKAIFLFHTMQERGCKPDLYTYNTVIQLYCGLGKFSEADGLLSTMADAECEPNQITYNIYLSGLLKMGKKAEADEFFKKMQRERRTDQVSYKIYTVHLRRFKDVDKLMSLSKYMCSRYGNVSVEICNAILQHYAESGNVDKAVQYFTEEMVKLTAPDEFSYALLVNALCRLGDFDAAKSVILEMFERGYKPTDLNYNPVIISLSMQSQEEEALKLFEEMKVKGIEPSAVSCEHLLKAFSNAGKVDVALDICRHIARKQLALKDSILFLFIRCLHKSNRLEEARCVIGEMQHSGCLSKQRRFKCALQAMLNGNMEEAEGFFEDPLGRKLPNLVSYTLRIQGCCKKNQVDDANVILLEMEELGCAPNASCYGPIITGLSRLGRLQESFRLFEKMVIRGIHSSVISGNLMKRLCEVKMVDEILKLGKYIIAKKLAIQVSSITFLIENGSAQDGSKDGSKDLSQLLHDLRESDCLVPRA